MNKRRSVDEEIKILPCFLLLLKDRPLEDSVCYDACVMREIGRQAHSHTHFVVLLQWNPSWHRACY